MRAGLLTEPVTFKRATITKNEYGQEVTYWENYIITRGNVKYNTGNRTIENQEIINTYTVIFTVRSYHKIDESMRVLYNKRLYRILSIDEDRLKQSTTIIGELVNE